ncbi:hypothetical protein N2C86_14955 [Enterococcus faecalis]|nr:hypothetical protein [Enterococcus faecalis]MCU2215781.1 hypothetical protein [Enterococcus faecalis]WCG77528.1 hypothetical protein PML83_02110 [Enterococcus faecalis]
MNYSLLQEEFPTIKKETFIHIKSGNKGFFFLVTGFFVPASLIKLD